MSSSRSKPVGETLKRSAQSSYWQNDATHLRRADPQFTENSPFACDHLRFCIALNSICSAKKSAKPLALTTLDEITLCNRVECFAMSCFFRVFVNSGWQSIFDELLLSSILLARLRISYDFNTRSCFFDFKKYFRCC